MIFFFVLFFQCDVLVLRSRQYGQIPAEDARYDDHRTSTVADGSRLLCQHLGPQLHDHRAPPHVPHQPNKHQAIDGDVLLILRPLRPVLL